MLNRFGGSLVQRERKEISVGAYLYYQYYENGRYTYGMYDLYNRELLHEIDSESFGTLQYVVGEGFYLWHNKSMYIRATDFWNKDLSKLISLE